jgi:hypothetical protein
LEKKAHNQFNTQERKSRFATSKAKKWFVFFKKKRDISNSEKGVKGIFAKLLKYIMFVIKNILKLLNINALIVSLVI